MVLHHLPGQLNVLRVDEVNALDRDAFVAAFGGVYEDTPSLAAATFEQRPFADRAALIDAFDGAANTLDDTEVLALLKAHPVLGSRAPMATASVREQAGAGLDEMHDAVRVAIATGNAAYLDRFGFPFIVAVRGLSVGDIAAELQARLRNDADTERHAAFAEVRTIARLRLEAMVAP